LLKPSAASTPVFAPSIPLSPPRPGAQTKTLSPIGERQILQRAGDGRSSAEIATELRLSEGTVRNYLSEAIAKLGAAKSIDAAHIARTRGWL
jgi:DNA-binding NarL/FixJ family response regulator